METTYSFNKTLRAIEECEPCSKCGGGQRYLSSKRCCRCQSIRSSNYKANPKFTARRRQVEFERDLKKLLNEED